MQSEERNEQGIRLRWLVETEDAQPSRSSRGSSAMGTAEHSVTGLQNRPINNVKTELGIITLTLFGCKCRPS